MEKYSKDLECVRQSNQNSNRNRRSIGYYVRNLGFACAISASSIGCQTIKEAGTVAGASAVGATVGGLVSGGVFAPAMGAATAAATADLIMQAENNSGKTQTIIKAPDNFFTLLDKIVGIGGWALILVFVVPMILGWLLPSPTKLNRKDND